MLSKVTSYKDSNQHMKKSLMDAHSERSQTSKMELFTEILDH